MRFTSQLLSVCLSLLAFGAVVAPRTCAAEEIEGVVEYFAYGDLLSPLDTFPSPDYTTSSVIEFESGSGHAYYLHNLTNIQYTFQYDYSFSLRAGALGQAQGTLTSSGMTGVNWASAGSDSYTHPGANLYWVWNGTAADDYSASAYTQVQVTSPQGSAAAEADTHYFRVVVEDP